MTSSLTTRTAYPGARRPLDRRVLLRIASDTPPSLTGSMAERGVHIDHHTLTVERTRPWPELSSLPGFWPIDRALEVERVALIAGVPVAYTVTQLCSKLVPGLAKQLPSPGSLHAVLRDHYGLDPVRDWCRARMTVPTRECAEHLSSSAPVWWLTEGLRAGRVARPLAMSTVFLRADVFDVSFGFDR